MVSPCIEACRVAAARKQAARSADLADQGLDPESTRLTHEEHFDVIAASMKEPDPAMLRRVLVVNDLTDQQLDFGAEVLEGMPPTPPDMQRRGIEAAGALYRDWRAMLAELGA